MENNKKILNFKVSSFRKIPNPYSASDNTGEKIPETYIMICDVKDVPKDIWMDTNPRMQNTKTNVAKKIQASLTGHTERDFYLLNRGLLISAKEVTTSNGNSEVSIVLSDRDLHGNVDGGHTYKIIQDYSDELERGEQFVRIEVITGIEDMFEKLAAARNTSVQVKDQSIAELENRFELIKEAFKNEEFYDEISYKENDIKRIEVSDILSILNMFNIDRYPTNSNVTMPLNSYNGKKSCIDAYIDAHKKNADQTKNPYYKMIPIMPDILRLYDHLETHMSSFYCEGSDGPKKYGKITGVGNSKNKFRSKFYANNMEHASPNGFLYPIIAAFRALVVESDGQYKWQVDPFQTLNKLGSDLVKNTIEVSRSSGNNPNATGKNNNLWQNLFMLVKMTTMEGK